MRQRLCSCGAARPFCSFASQTCCITLCSGLVVCRCRQHGSKVLVCIGQQLLCCGQIEVLHHVLWQEKGARCIFLQIMTLIQGLARLYCVFSEKKPRWITLDLR